MTRPHGLAPGRLLVATALLRDPNFVRTVLLLIETDDNGALGVILNRPSTVAVAEVLPSWASAVPSDAVMLAGGPVETDSALALAFADEDRSAALPGFRPLVGRLGAVDLDADPDEVAPWLRGMRVFAGYAGWGPGQLEGECDEGAWTVVDAVPEDHLPTKPENLWERVQRRQPGDQAWLATMPIDPTAN